MGLYDWELASVRDAMLDVMPDLCDVYRRTAGGDEYGGGSGYDAAPVAQAVKCQVLPLAVNAYSETPIAGGAQRETDVQQFEIAFPYGTDVRAGDKVVVTSLAGAEIVIRQVEATESWDAIVTAQGTEAR